MLVGVTVVADDTDVEDADENAAGVSLLAKNVENRNV